MSAPKRFVTRRIEVEAQQVPVTDGLDGYALNQAVVELDAVAAWCGGEVDLSVITGNWMLWVDAHPAIGGSWIVNEAERWTVLSDDEFQKRYERAAQEARR